MNNSVFKIVEFIWDDKKSPTVIKNFSLKVPKNLRLLNFPKKLCSRGALLRTEKRFLGRTLIRSAAVENPRKY